MTIQNDTWHRTLAIAILTLAPAFATTARPSGSQAVMPQLAAANPIASVDPRVPVAAGRPCVVDLLQDRPWPQADLYRDIDASITYMPPSACPPPWSKVILKLDMQTSRRSVLDTLGMDLGGVRLFRSAVPRYDGQSSWHAERDLTDYSALFKVPHTGRIWSGQNPEAIDWGWDHLTPVYYGNARLLFYPSTAATPAPRVPDAVIGVNQDTPANLPHNVVRAYLDVENVFPTPFNDLVWFTCWSDDAADLPLADIFAPGTKPKNSINPPLQGCGGGSFRELKVKVDGTLAGIAPAFPLLIADMNEYFPNSVDFPITSPEMLNAKPYRIDLSPFAAILSAAGPHRIATSTPPLNEGEGRPGGATLLLYLDHQRAQVTGAVTLNTLATENGAPTDVNTIRQHFGITQGGIRTRQHRDFTIRGFVDSSGGRIDSSVHQTDYYTTLQDFHLAGPQWPGDENPVDKEYFLDIWLTSDVVQTSRRSMGTQLISEDQLSTSYPLRLTWKMASRIQLGDAFQVHFYRTNITVRQHRVIDGDHSKPGFGHYTTHVDDLFCTTHKVGGGPLYARWEGATTRTFIDNFGSCYDARLDSRDGAIIHRNHGFACPGGQNRVRWFAHPDGSADTLGWWH